MTPTPATSPNGNGNGIRLVWWLMTTAIGLVVLLATALANDMRGTLAKNATDISALQQSEARTAQALEDIRHDLKELLEQKNQEKTK